MLPFAEEVTKLHFANRDWLGAAAETIQELEEAVLETIPSGVD